MADKVDERTLQQTSTWAVAVVCFFLLLISIVIEKLIHKLGTCFKRKNKKALYEALEKVKAELMLMGFISLLLTIGQNYISQICISESIAASMRPCSKSEELEEYPPKTNDTGKDEGDEENSGRKLLELVESFIPRRSLATKGYDKCAEKGKVAFVSSYGMHQLHIFIFVLAVCHVIYCIVTYALGKTKMRRWKRWEEETKTIEYQYSHDPERFRFARDTSFGRRHLNFWSKSTITLWIACFFRQFFGSVTKVDYLTLRHGFIMAHLAPGSDARFDFRKYIQRSLEEDFKTIVEISPVIWFVAVLFLLTTTHGLNSYLWQPFIPLVVILIVGTKLQVIITKLGLLIQEKGEIVKGMPLVQPGDHLFWFGRPRFILFLVHLVLFTNAFQLAFFAWSTYEFGIKNCFHKSTVDVVIRISIGIIVQFLCSYVTLPLYALVTQMGSKMKPTVFNERVAVALKSWHHTAKKQIKHGRTSESTTPFSSRPATPTHGSSPIHLLRNVHKRSRSADESFANSPSPRNSDFDTWDVESQQEPGSSSVKYHSRFREEDSEKKKPSSSSVELPPGPGQIRTHQHEISRQEAGGTKRKQPDYSIQENGRPT
ncbi:MLO-like protein 6 [Hirschfeldia incana]|nr:MLO-like protein 6 [Hirschfeldia incana]